MSTSTKSIAILLTILTSVALVACLNEDERPAPAGYNVDGGYYSELGDAAARPDSGDAGDADADAASSD